MSEKTTTRASRYLFEAFEAKCGDALAKLVLLNLANRADNDGQCWPSLKRLAEDCETTTRTVIRKLEMLEAMGYLKRIRRAKDGMKTSNLYRLPNARQGFSVVTESHIEVSESHIEVSESHLGSDTVSQGVVTESHIKHAVETPNETRSTRATKKFLKPDVGQVAEYMIERSVPKRGAQYEAETFCDHYESNGWKVGGKSPMKDWKAAVRNWLKNDFRKKDQARTKYNRREI